MGLEIDRERFDEADFARFAERLERSLAALRELLARPGFGEGPRSLGAELELFLIDAEGRPLPLNLAVLRETVDPRLTVELDRFNLECNLRWSPLAGRPFAALRRELEDALGEVRRAAATHRGRVATIGILPTLRAADLERDAMTDVPRYRALSAGIQRLRRGPVRVRIDGRDPLEILCDDVTFEGANTSFQIHLRAAPGEFADLYNAVQLATGPALAVAVNSPTFLGHRLWEETRVALFKQAVDSRSGERGREPRVDFGTGWAVEGVWELFAASVALHEPLLPILSDEDPLLRVRAGGIPALDEMRLHQGTVWSWNRAIYDPADGGHLRIEMRFLPSGPTVTDMVANAAFAVGLGLGLAAHGPAVVRAVPFSAAEGNFYRAAQHGLDAELVWPPEPGAVPAPVAARALVARLVPVAHRGLVAAGVEPDEAEAVLDRVARRAAAGQTGASWQRQTLAALEPSVGRSEGLRLTFGRYLERSEAGQPVHEWPVVAPPLLRALEAPAADAVPDTPEGLLRRLGGPAILRLAGRDRSRRRAVATLLHGNEPSGLRAVHALLRAGFVPAVDTLFVIGAVGAALEPPGFAHRQLPGARDLNRCFRPPFDGPEGGLAEAVLHRLREERPEALLDLHNNTGHSPPYGVVPRAGGVELGIVACFADRAVASDLGIGALVETTADAFPSVVVECGRVGDAAADALARAGLEQFLSEDRLPAARAGRVSVAHDPVRVRVRPGVRLAVGASAEPGAGLTLAAEIDRHNWETLAPGFAIGWLGAAAGWPLVAVGADGTDVSRALFEAREGVLRTKTDLIPMMLTTDARIASSDCLFYAVRPAGLARP